MAARLLDQRLVDEPRELGRVEPAARRGRGCDAAFGYASGPADRAARCARPSRERRRGGAAAAASRARWRAAPGAAIEDRAARRATGDGRGWSVGCRRLVRFRARRRSRRPSRRSVVGEARGHPAPPLAAESSRLLRAGRPRRTRARRLRGERMRLASSLRRSGRRAPPAACRRCTPRPAAAPRLRRAAPAAAPALGCAAGLRARARGACRRPPAAAAPMPRRLRRGARQTGARGSAPAAPPAAAAAPPAAERRTAARRPAAPGRTRQRCLVAPPRRERRRGRLPAPRLPRVAAVPGAAFPLRAAAALDQRPNGETGRDERRPRATSDSALLAPAPTASRRDQSEGAPRARRRQPQRTHRLAERVGLSGLRSSRSLEQLEVEQHLAERQLADLLRRPAERARASRNVAFESGASTASASSLDGRRRSR